jgi:hypothetical protein
MNQRAGAWGWLEQRHDVDVALLQETAKPPAWTRDVFPSCIWRPKHASTRPEGSLWGTAVLGRSLKLDPFEPDSRYPWLAELVGSTAIARTAGQPTWLVSAHLSATQISEAVLERIPIADMEPTALRKRADGYTVWEANVIPHELHRLFANDTFLWGGDLNTDPRMDDFSGFAGGNRRLFDIYRKAGSYDIRHRFHNDYQQTFFRKGIRLGWQLDHVFSDATTEANATAWNVDPTPAVGDAASSDHAPIIVDIEV